MERGAGDGEKSLNPQNDEVLSFSVVPPTPPLPHGGFILQKTRIFVGVVPCVPTPSTDEKSVISEIGASTRAPPLRENETALPSPHQLSFLVRMKQHCFKKGGIRVFSFVPLIAIS
jgi:hypothetical protein